MNWNFDAISAQGYPFSMSYYSIKSDKKYQWYFPYFCPRYAQKLCIFRLAFTVLVFKVLVNFRILSLLKLWMNASHMGMYVHLFVMYSQHFLVTTNRVLLELFDKAKVDCSGPCLEHNISNFLVQLLLEGLHGILTTN